MALKGAFTLLIKYDPSGTDRDEWWSLHLFLVGGAASQARQEYFVKSTTVSLVSQKIGSLSTQPMVMLNLKSRISLVSPGARGTTKARDGITLVYTHTCMY